MRDKTHMEHVERWANYVRNNPDWKKIHTEFINSIFENAFHAINELKKTKEGQRKIKEMYRIENLNGYPDIFKQKNEN